MSRSSSELCTAWGAMGGVSVLAARSAGADAKHLRSMAYELPVGSFGRSPAGAPDADTKIDCRDNLQRNHTKRRKTAVGVRERADVVGWGRGEGVERVGERR